MRLLFSLCLSGECRSFANGYGFFVHANVGRATKCRSSFRPVALCLAEIEPFYWPPDSSNNTVKGFVK